MPIYEVSWTIKMSSNNEQAINPPGEAALTAMYPSISEAGSPEGVNIYLTTDSGRLAEVSVSQRVSAGNPQTARAYVTGGNAFTSDAGVASLVNDATIDIEVSDLTVTDFYSGTSVVLDKGTYVPSPTAPAPRRRTRAKAVEVAEESDDVSVPSMEISEEPAPAPRRRGRPRNQPEEPVVDNATTDQGEEE